MNEAAAPIFVIGTGRSGTTLLRLMLCAHPRIYITHEASFYVWESIHGRRGPLDAFLAYYFQTHSFRWLRLDPSRVTASLPSSPPRLADVYAGVMREKAASYGRPRFGDKTPSHAAHLGRVFEDFPGARVVHIVRDPRDTALSLSRMPWACASLQANAGLCEIERKQVAPYRDRMLQIRLEDLLAAPQDTMKEVLAYVGEPWDDAVLDHARHAPDPHDMPPLPWLESAAKDRRAPEKKWLALTPADIRIIEHVAQRVMKEHGYAPAELADEPSRLSLAWARICDLPEIVRCLVAYTRLGWRMRDARTFDTPAVKALFHRVNPGSWALYPGFDLPAAPPLLGPAPAP
jgi:Sulfotransferase family